MHRLGRSAICLLVLAGLPTSARADDWRDCRQGDTDLRIAACSQIISANKESKSQLANAYGYRGIAYRIKGDLDRAIADHTKASELAPTTAGHLNNRGYVHHIRKSYDLAISDFTKAIENDPRYASAYGNRGNSYYSKKDYDLAIADYTKAFEIDPKSAVNIANRGNAYSSKKEFDLAIADYTKAIEIDPKTAVYFNSRGNCHNSKKDFDLAIADYTKAIEIDPKTAYHFNNRGNAFYSKKDYDRAIADYTRAVELDAKYAFGYSNRGNAYNAKKDYDRAVADQSKAIEVDPNHALAYSHRAKVYESQGKRDAAIADYRKVLELPAPIAADAQRQEVARDRIGRLTAATVQAASKPAPRVALVIGNSKYAHNSALENPKNDARAIAAALGRLGFLVSEHHDVDRAMMGRALKEFGDRVEGSEWAVVFFAGHGLELNGNTYLLPVDAELKRDSHVADEAVSLSQVQAKVDAASKIGLVILDSCRNNPFVTRMVRSAGATRSVGRGLGVVEPEGNVLVAYAAKHGTTALDGTGQNSPFTEALLAHIEEPALEINFLFRKVIDRVRKATAKKQEPFIYGSWGSEQLFFKTAAAQ